MTNNLIYVAGAYSGNISENIAKAEAVSIILIQNGWHVITPHKNTAGYEKYEGTAGLCKDTWITMDLNILNRCDILYVLDNWRESKGTRAEIAFAESNGIQIVYEEDSSADTFEYVRI